MLEAISLLVTVRMHSIVVESKGQRVSFWKISSFPWTILCPLWGLALFI